MEAERWFPHLGLEADVSAGTGGPQGRHVMVRARIRQRRSRPPGAAAAARLLPAGRAAGVHLHWNAQRGVSDAALR